MPRDLESLQDEDIELDAQLAGDFVSHRDAAAGQTKHQNVGTMAVSREPLGEGGSCLASIVERLFHRLHRRM